MEYSLTLTFLTTSGQKASLTIENVKTNLTDPEIATLMNTILEKNIFLTKNGSYTEKVQAQITQKQVTKIDMK